MTAAESLVVSSYLLILFGMAGATTTVLRAIFRVDPEKSL
jgi:hypothetical protein